MGTLMDNKLLNTFLPFTFVYDLEYVGVPNNLEMCYIWDIGIIHLVSGRSFNVTIDPGIRPLPPPMSSDFVHVTELFLMQRNATTFHSAWNACLTWISQFTTSKVLLISHNNFKSDKLMLEIECKRRDLPLPLNWFFFDSLLYCRKVIPKQTSYTLHDLYKGIMNLPILDNHSALPDAKALVEILYYTGIQNIEGPIYPTKSTSLQIVKWLGPSCERKLFDISIRSLEQLIANIKAVYSTMVLQSPIHVDIHDFVLDYIVDACGLTIGNSESISESIIAKWL